jgi:hypothetical protein
VVVGWRALPLAIVASCATGAQSSGRPAASSGASTGEMPAPPPQGSKRLPSSVDCEPQPPCAEDCVTAYGEKGRRLGSLDKEVIRDVVRSHLSEAKACYDAITFTHGDAAGKVMVRFGIAPSGGVETSCLVSSALNDPSVDRCVVDLPLTWRFPKPEGGGWVVVSYPFIFFR